MTDLKTYEKPVDGRSNFKDVIGLYHTKSEALSEIKIEQQKEEAYTRKISRIKFRCGMQEIVRRKQT